MKPDVKNAPAAEHKSDCNGLKANYQNHVGNFVTTHIILEVGCACQGGLEPQPMSCTPKTLRMIRTYMNCCVFETSLFYVILHPYHALMFRLPFEHFH